MDQPQMFPPPQQPPIAAVPNPNLIPSHVSYNEMITAAILWDYSQGKKDGSSKRAIANYIDRLHPNLPATHPALLTHYLKQLKNSGQLVMIKKSYQLPSFARSPEQRGVPLEHVSPQQPGVPLEHASPQKPVVPLEHLSPQKPDSLTTTKRKPGRPPKVKRPDSEIKSVLKQVVGNGSVLGKRPRGRPPKAGVELIVDRDSEMELGSNGQVGLRTGKIQSPPPRIQAEQVVHVVVQAQEVVQAQDVVLKKRPGRPAKKHVLGSVLGPVGIGMKKKGWPRGRPRGKKGVSVVIGKRRGRKPKWSMLPKREYTGKPRGRPRKNFASAKPSPEQEEKANQELLRTLEEMQSKIKDAVGIIRSHITDQSPPDALTALQQLEHLSTMNVTAPALTASPLTSVPTDAMAPPPSTSAPEALATPTPTDPTMTAFPGPPGMNVPYSFTTNTASMVMSVPLHAESSSGNQHTFGWVPANEAGP